MAAALPLSGLLVVSIEQAVAAPQCTCRLADAGARVIKVERPEGDFARDYDHVVHGESANFVWLNRGKESVICDLTKPDDKKLLEAMLAFRSGDFSVRLPSGWFGIYGKIADTFNDVLIMNERRASETARVQRPPTSSP